jgi:hypothetical protein
LDIVVAVSTEGCDKEGWIVVEGIVAGDSEEEVALYVLVLGAPDFFTVLVDDSVLVRVVGDGGGTRRGGEEVREELGFQGYGERKVGEDRSGQSGGGDDGDRSFNDGRWEVLDRDVSEGDSLDNFFEL